MIVACTPRPVHGVEAANRAWGSTCVPAAIAAALGLTLDQVRNMVLADLLPERGDERVAVDWMARVEPI